MPTSRLTTIGEYLLSFLSIIWLLKCMEDDRAGADTMRTQSYNLGSFFLFWRHTLDVGMNEL